MCSEEEGGRGGTYLEHGEGLRPLTPVRALVRDDLIHLLQRKGQKEGNR